MLFCIFLAKIPQGVDPPLFRFLIERICLFLQEDEEHDSGTESDDEQVDLEELEEVGKITSKG